jgi:hypothetical protein
MEVCFKKIKLYGSLISTSSVKNEPISLKTTTLLFE